VVAFAGIARPRKFYRTLQQLGADVRRMEAYPDHHAFTQKDFASLRSKAEELGGRLVTTEKDYARLPEAMRAEVLSIPVRAVFEDAAALLAMVPAIV
jgi:tetraacyldisaccharide 4'-kinase